MKGEKKMMTPFKHELGTVLKDIVILMLQRCEQ